MERSWVQTGFHYWRMDGMRYQDLKRSVFNININRYRNSLNYGLYETTVEIQYCIFLFYREAIWKSLFSYNIKY